MLCFPVQMPYYNDFRYECGRHSWLVCYRGGKRYVLRRFRIARSAERSEA